MESFFSSYIRSIASIGICAFICQWITQSSNTGSKKALNFISSLCIFISVIFPFLNGIKNYNASIPKNIPLNNEQITDYSEYDSFLELTKNDICERIKSEIFTKTGIKVTDISIALHIEDNTLIIDNVELTIPNDSTDSIESVSDIIYRHLNVHPQINQDGKEDKSNDGT